MSESRDKNQNEETQNQAHNDELEEIYKLISQAPAPEIREPVRRRPRQKKKKRSLHFLGLVSVTVLVALLLVFAIFRYRQDLQTPPTAPKLPAEDFVSAQDGQTLTIAAAGDINISQALLDSARSADGTYDFSEIFMGAASLLSGADLTVADLEVNFCGAPYDPAMHNCPESLLEALLGAGVDLVQTANTVSVYNGIGGLSTTLNAVRDAGLTPVGTFATNQEYRQSGGFTMVEAQGFRIAFVAFTKGVDNLKLPEGSERCVNLLYEDYYTTYQDVDTEGIQQVLEAVRKEKPDITIALLHWGSAYDDGISSTQKEIRDLMQAGGVDVILGTHSHLVGPVEQTQGMLTAYSLGNLLSVDEESGTNQGIVLKLEFTKKQGNTELTGWSYDPVYLADGTQTGTGSYALWNTENQIGLYTASYIDRVSQEVYEALCKSRDRIAERIVMDTE